ncbi:hypothetical protein [Dactylosporangium sp. NPDC048998]|uniref:hypothetical protein n=1 Tax=Dactylosporangium sp. NPDC048998 TaxID=3363976 RepID=UPI00371D1B69
MAAVSSSWPGWREPGSSTKVPAAPELRRRRSAAATSHHERAEWTALNRAQSLPDCGILRKCRTTFCARRRLSEDETGAPELGITELFKNGLGEVERTDATHFTGTVDVTAANSVLTPSDDVLKKAGAKARSVPFTATIDDRGRLTAFNIQGASIDPDLAMELTFTGFGSVLPITEPTDAIPAPDSVYGLFN